MNDHTLFDDEIVDVAFGAVPSQSLTLHLQSCAACSLEVDRRRAFAQIIDTEVRARVGAEAAPRLNEVLVTAPRGAGARRRIRVWTAAPIAAALAAALLIIVIRFSGLVGIHHESGSAQLMAWRSPTASLLTQNLSIVRTPFDIHLEHLL